MDYRLLRTFSSALGLILPQDLRQASRFPEPVLAEVLFPFSITAALISARVSSWDIRVLVIRAVTVMVCGGGDGGRRLEWEGLWY